MAYGGVERASDGETQGGTRVGATHVTARDRKHPRRAHPAGCREAGVGATHVTVTIRNPANPDRAWEGLFLVDTGATDSLVPGQYLEAIGLRPKGRRVYELADGREIGEDRGRTRIRTGASSRKGLSISLFHLISTTHSSASRARVVTRMRFPSLCTALPGTCGTAPGRHGRRRGRDPTVDRSAPFSRSRPWRGGFRRRLPLPDRRRTLRSGAATARARHPRSP